jgi:alcohol dehydrogenase class IV
LRRFVNTNGLLSLQDLGVQTTEFESISILGLGASSTKANPVQLDKTDVCRVLQLT